MEASRERLIIEHLAWGKAIAEEALLSCGIERTSRYFDDCVSAGMLGLTRAATFWDCETPFADYAAGYIEEFVYGELRAWVDSSVPACSVSLDGESETVGRLLEGLQSVDARRYELMWRWAQGEPVAALAECYEMTAQQVCNIRDGTIETLRSLHAKLLEERTRPALHG